MTRNPETITLIGAGLNGPLLALGLVKRGFKVQIYERRPDMRRVRMSAGRSINLALYLLAAFTPSKKLVCGTRCGRSSSR